LVLAFGGGTTTFFNTKAHGFGGIWWDLVRSGEIWWDLVGRSSGVINLMIPPDPGIWWLVAGGIWWGMC
jgi:hypothetical protein